MAAAIGGRHTVTGVTTIPTPRRTVAPITEAMVIIIQRRTMTPPRELMAGKPPLTALTDRRLAGPVTIPTRGHMLEALQSRRPTAAEVQHRLTIHTPAHTLRRDKVRARMLSGVAPMYRGGTRALPWAITPPPMEQWQAPLIRREEKRRLLARSGGTPQ